jgi:hypothetical protein
LKKKISVVPTFVWYAPLGFRVPKGVCTALAYSKNRFWLRFEAHTTRDGQAPEWLAFDQLLGIPEALAWFALSRVLGRPVLMESAVVRALKMANPGYDKWLAFWGEAM